MVDVCLDSAIIGLPLHGSYSFWYDGVSQAGNLGQTLYRKIQKKFRNQNHKMKVLITIVFLIMFLIFIF